MPITVQITSKSVFAQKDSERVERAKGTARTSQVAKRSWVVFLSLTNRERNEAARFCSCTDLVGEPSGVRALAS